EFAVAGDADLERDGLFGQLVFAAADVGDLRDRVDADRHQVAADGVDLFAAGRVGGEPALFHGGGGERGEADDVADRVDVLDGGAEPFVHLDPAAAVRRQSGPLEVQRFGEPLPAGGV